jgi:hypothetical protein
MDYARGKRHFFPPLKDFSGIRGGTFHMSDSLQAWLLLSHGPEAATALISFFLRRCPILQNRKPRGLAAPGVFEN